ncbi:MAG: hypothetical protein WCS30_09360 [Selenomonadaceae bacterium]
MKSITQDNCQTKCLSAKSMQFFQQYRIAKILHAANANKIKGIPAQVSLYADENLQPDMLPFGRIRSTVS